MVAPHSTLPEILSAVHAAHKRVTVAKRTVAEVLVSATHHLTVDEITSAVQDGHPDISQSTIYRILEEFENLDVVVHTHLGQSAAVYHLAGVPHGHLTCEHCGATLELPGVHFDALSNELMATYGFRLDRHHVALSGTCRSCGSH